MDLGGKVSVLHEFSGMPSGGSHPAGALIEARDGHLYGVTAQGGTAGQGAVFRF
jgi:hypothetical protein